MEHAILVAVDFSPHSRRALDAAIELAKDHGGRLLLLHVRKHVTNEDAPATSPLQQVELEVQVAEAVELSSKWAKKARDAGLDVEVLSPTGQAAAEILRAATDHDVALIAVGTRGRSGLKRLGLGSVAEAVVRRSDRPVLVVPKAAR